MSRYEDLCKKLSEIIEYNDKYKHEALDIAVKFSESLNNYMVGQQNGLNNPHVKNHPVDLVCVDPSWEPKNSNFSYNDMVIDPNGFFIFCIIIELGLVGRGHYYYQIPCGIKPWSIPHGAPLFIGNPKDKRDMYKEFTWTGGHASECPEEYIISRLDKLIDKERY